MQPLMPPNLGLSHVEASLKNLFDGLDLLAERELIQPSLVLIYSILDSLASLARPEESKYVSRADFLDFTNRYLLRLGVEPECAAVDLYAARCGVLHTGSPESRLADEGKARRISYAWGTADVSVLRELIHRLDREADLIGLHINDVIAALKEGSVTFFRDVRANSSLQALVESRTKMFTPLELNTANQFLRGTDL